MVDVLVVVEANQGGLKKTSLELLTLARRLGSPVAVVLGAAGLADRLAPQLAEYGARLVLVAEHPDLEEYLVAPKATVLAQVIRDRQPAAVLLPGSQEGRELAGRLAVRLDNGLLVDVDSVDPDGIATQVVLAGSTTVRSRVTRGIPLVTVRAGAVDPGPDSQGVAQLPREEVPVVLADTDRLARVTERHVEQRAGRPDLGEADVVVAGGRGLAGPEKFALVEELADLLGGAVGTTRAAADAGYYPHQYQIGQTGRNVSPRLYLALGISGAIQHRAGMQTSGTIVAVNKDPEAPIFELADFGVVGDLATLLPQVIEEIRRRRSG